MREYLHREGLTRSSRLWAQPLLDVTPAGGFAFRLEAKLQADERLHLLHGLTQETRDRSAPTLQRILQTRATDSATPKNP